MRDPLLVTAALLLLPLIPSIIIYLILTPKKNLNANRDRAQGKYEGRFLEFGKFSIEFNVFGSTATYIVLLCAAYFIHGNIEAAEVRRIAVQNQQAWLVEVPVQLEKDKKPVPANNKEMQQVRVELEPNLTRAYANKLQFWVVPNNGSFPTVRFTIPKLSLRPQTLDLNDKKRIKYDHELRKMSGIEPVWISVGDVYSYQ